MTPFYLWAFCLLPPALAAFSPASPDHDLGACRADRAALSARLAELEAQLLSIRGPSVDIPPKQDLVEKIELPGGPGFVKNVVMSLTCVMLAALAAGLTMGLVSLEPMEMEIIVNSEEKDMEEEKDRLKLKADQMAANSVLPLIKEHHRLLVTLLLMNSLANEALPLFLDNLVPSWLAVLLSVTLVLIFGEIIPSAVFTGSEQLRIAASFAPLVTLCRFLLSPIAVPIAIVLDCLLGEDHKGRYNFAELRAIVGIHKELHSGEPQPVVFKNHDNKGLGIITTETQHNFTEHSIVLFTGQSSKLHDGTKYFVKPCAPLKGRDNHYTFKLYSSEGRHASDVITFAPGELTSGTFTLQERDELKIMHGVMSLTHMTANAAMVPLSKACMLEGSQRLSKDLLREILDTGYSRIPVYQRHAHNIRGFILVKKLIVVSPDEEEGRGRCVESVGVDGLVVVPPTMPMLDLLNRFQEDRCHLALVTNMPTKVKAAWKSGVEIPPDVHMAGIITLEDVIEKLLQEDIEDEHDAYKQKKNTDKPSMLPLLNPSSTRSFKVPASTMGHLEEPLLP